MGTSQRFLPHIEGMRALAVIAVIINHLNAQILPGGFLGVDVFFVVSGFVITRSLMSRPIGSIGSGLAWFYTRRIKRIVPAIVFVVIITVPLLRLVDPAPANSTFAALGSLFGVSNIFFWLTASDYFGAAIESNPLMHTWSLGVEEQFYFVFPLVFFLFAARRKDQPIALMIVLAVTTLASGMAFILNFHENTPAVYFLVPFRAWELGLGCLLALTPAVLERLKPMLQVLALAMIGYGFGFGETNPVTATVSAVFGSAFLIASGDKQGVINTCLNVPSAQFVGRLSYSLYLWHWPVICLFLWTLGVSSATIAPIIFITLLMSAFSYYAVEKPLRKAIWFKSAHLNIFVGVTVSVVAAIAIFGMHRMNLPAFSGDKNNVIALDGYQPGTVLPITNRKVANCLGGDIGLDRDAARAAMQTCSAHVPNAKTHLIFFGDSHALDMFGASEVLFNQRIASVSNFGQPGCRVPMLANEGEHCRYFESVLDIAATNPYDAEQIWIVLRANYNPRSISGALSDYSEKIQAFMEDAQSRGMKVIFVAPAPKYAALSQGGLCAVQWFRPEWALASRCKDGFRESREEQYNRRIGFLNELLRLQNESETLEVFDPFDALCGSDPNACFAVQNGVYIYRDDSHITEAGADLLGTALAQYVESLETKDALTPSD